MTLLPFHAIAASRGDGLRPELKARLDRLAERLSEPVTREDGMVQSGPNGLTKPLRADTARPKLTVCVK
jgi:hypothetical protein